VCVTRDLRIHGYAEQTKQLGSPWVYGSGAEKIRGFAGESPELGMQLDAELPYIIAELVWAVRKEKWPAHLKMWSRAAHVRCF
jgi:glycerol-3-phosphate dehydrogenase